jgi:hypothetical protein
MVARWFSVLPPVHQRLRVRAPWTSFFALDVSFFAFLLLWGVVWLKIWESRRVLVMGVAGQSTPLSAVCAQLRLANLARDRSHF